MYCFVEIKNGVFGKCVTLDKDSEADVRRAITNVGKITEAHESLLYVKDALNDFAVQVKNFKIDGEMVCRNLHAAERYCRAFLFEFKTYLDHMQTMLSHTYGRQSQALALFENGTHDAYDRSPEYAFTYQLRNYSQHLENVVHTFDSGANAVRPCCISEKLLSEYEKWKSVERQFICKTDKIDLLAVFKKAYDAISYIHIPVMQYMLDQNGTAADIIYLRKWASCLTGEHKCVANEIWYWHFAHVLRTDGAELAKEEYSTDTNRKYDVSVVKWNALYDLAASMSERK